MANSTVLPGFMNPDPRSNRTNPLYKFREDTEIPVFWTATPPPESGLFCLCGNSSTEFNETWASLPEAKRYNVSFTSYNVSLSNQFLVRLENYPDENHTLCVFELYRNASNFYNATSWGNDVSQSGFFEYIDGDDGISSPSTTGSLSASSSSSSSSSTPTETIGVVQWGSSGSTFYDGGRGDGKNLKVGLGVGIPLLLAIALLGFLFQKRRRRRARWIRQGRELLDKDSDRYFKPELEDTSPHLERAEKSLSPWVRAVELVGGWGEVQELQGSPVERGELEAVGKVIEPPPIYIPIPDCDLESRRSGSAGIVSPLTPGSGHHVGSEASRSPVSPADEKSGAVK